MENRVALLHLYPAHPAPAELPCDHVHLGAQVTHLLHLLTPLIKGAHPSGDESVHTLVTAAEFAVDDPGRIDHHLWVVVGQRAVDIEAVKGLIHPPHDLQVLLRHRLLRQSGGFEGLPPIQINLTLEDLALSKQPECRDFPTHGDATSRASANESIQLDHAVSACIHKPVVLDMEPLKHR